MIPKHNAFYGYVIAFAVLSSLFAKLMVTDEIELHDSEGHSADFFSVGYEKWQMNEQGTLGSYLTANKMTHFSDDGSTQLDSPQVHFFANSNPTWEIKAENGQLLKGGETLWLNRNVDIERLENNQVTPLSILTSNLEVMPQKSFARTTELTTLQSDKNITTGVGMEVTFSSPIHLALLTKVHSHYEKK